MILYGAMIFALFVLTISVLMKIPGLELIIRPIFEWAVKIIEFIFVRIFFSWIMYAIGGIWRSHKIVASHFVHEEEYFDLKLRVERLNRGG